jgi:protein SCO1/2
MKAEDNPKQQDDYLVDHSIILYLMDTHGEFMHHFGNNLEEDELVERLKKEIGGVIGLEEQAPLWRKWLKL